MGGGNPSNILLGDILSISRAIKNGKWSDSYIALYITDARRVEKLVRRAGSVIGARLKKTKMGGA